MCAEETHGWSRECDHFCALKAARLVDTVSCWKFLATETSDVELLLDLLYRRLPGGMAAEAAAAAEDEAATGTLQHCDDGRELVVLPGLLECLLPWLLQAAS